LEEHYANVLNSGRTEAGLKALAFRNDVRVRQEACSVAEKGADGIVGAQRTGDNYWDVVLDPKALDSEIKRIATAPTAYNHVSVGVWYAASAQYPAGAYLVLIYPEHSAAYEAFWGHFTSRILFSTSHVLISTGKNGCRQLAAISSRGKNIFASSVIFD
jgi:hypothetical protein